MTLGEKAVELAAQSIGVTEETPNWGRWVKVYLTFIGLVRPAPWCGAFVAYKIHQAAGALGVAAQWPKTGYVPSAVTWARKRGLVADHPAAGMAFAVWHADKGRYAHIGFIRRVYQHGGKTYFVTVEGNSNDTGGREGTKVACNRRVWGRKYLAIKIV